MEELHLTNYIERCKEIFSIQLSKIEKDDHPIPKVDDHLVTNRRLFESAIKESEETPEFILFSEKVKQGPLKNDIDRLVVKEKKRREKNPKIAKSQSIDKWKIRVAQNAVKAFLRNTGTYIKIWRKIDIGVSELLDSLNNYDKSSELIRLYVFDGFVLYNNSRTPLKDIPLSIGTIKKYSNKELKEILKFPQSVAHGLITPEAIENMSFWHILTTIEREKYRGIPGIWIGGVMLSPSRFDDSEKTQKREDDVEAIGPVFLCIGEVANIATEIQIRTNIFDFVPIYYRVRNGFLPWDYHDDEGEPHPRTLIKHVGENGDYLRNIHNIWRSINSVDKRGHLKRPTELYVRSILNLNTYYYSLMESFVGFVAVIELLLTPGRKENLKYLIAMRGAAILTSNAQDRMVISNILSGFYDTRSQIVHEGHPDKYSSHDIENMISNNLAEVTRQIFIRYICLLQIGLDNDLPDWILKTPNTLKSNNQRQNTIANILDGLLLDSSLTDLLEKKMEERGLYDNWVERRRWKS